jgi:UDPglucose 6-dehydrogenase
LFQAFDDILNNTSKESLKIICVKSTVSPGTMAKLIKRLHETGRQDIDLAYNPEFMREGSALNDVLHRNPVVLASYSDYALKKLDGIYTRLLGSDKVNFIKTNFETAEVIKYAWNSFSAIRIAYVNELALLSRKFGADISSIIRGLALSEELLPTKKLIPGPGYGGSCLPKDTTGFSRIIEQEGFSKSMVHQAIDSNKKHVDYLIDDIRSQLKDSGEGNTVTLLGLSFKANTNDIRNAPSINIIRSLLDQGVCVKAFDPKAMSEMKVMFPGVEYYDSPYNAIKNTDCIVVLTEWEEIINLNLTKASSLCRHKKIIDTRNLFNTQILHDLGFDYINMGKF